MALTFKTNIYVPANQEFNLTHIFSAEIEKSEDTTSIVSVNDVEVTIWYMDAKGNHFSITGRGTIEITSKHF